MGLVGIILLMRTNVKKVNKSEDKKIYHARDERYTPMNRNVKLRSQVCLSQHTPEERERRSEATVHSELLLRRALERRERRNRSSLKSTSSMTITVDTQSSDRVSCKSSVLR